MNFDLKTLIGKLSPTCREGLETAAQLCVVQTHYNVEIEHYLLKLLDVSNSDIQRVLRHYDVDPAPVSRELTRTLDRFKRGNSRTPALSPHILELIQEAWLLSSIQLGEDRVRSGALFLAMLDHDALRGVILESAPSLRMIPRESLRQDILKLIRTSVEAVEAGLESGVTTLSRPSGSSSPERSKTPALDQYTIDLTAQARAGKIDPIRGRDFEIRQIIDILTRRRQNNPILTGEAGVGKTAVVEGFARRVVQGDIPPSLRNISVRTLDLGLLQAGAGVKGEFENRLKSVISEVKASPQPIILFIDEAHTLIGAGGQAGQGDAANLLKPALARGELRTIAATTWSEYKKYFEKDAALTRRFQVIRVEEPTEEVAEEMLRGVVENLERHHGVRILDEAVKDAVRLSHRYISGRQLPDKAISVLDTACARVAIGQNGTPATVEDAVRRIEGLEQEIAILKREQTSGQHHVPRIEELAEALKRAEGARKRVEARWQKELHIVTKIRELEQEQWVSLKEEGEDSGLSDSALQGELSRLKNDMKGLPGGAEDVDRLNRVVLQGELARLKKELKLLQGDDPMVPTCVDSTIVASVVSGWTGIPVGKMLTDEINSILKLKEKMMERIVGQSQALEAISRRIRTSRADLVDPAKPVGVFLLVGPSGVGKTETAVTLAELLYGGERNMIVVNMSEYQEAHTVSSLKGAPPGYVGYGKGGVLTEAVRRNPYSVVLLDEVEKAHPDVMELFYQVFDKGTLEDGEGVSVDFKNTIIILTSNVGTEMIMQVCRGAAARPDPENLVELVRPALLKHFKPAFLGRLVTVPYYPLGDREIRDIVKLKLGKIQQRFRENHRSELSYHEDLVAAVAARCAEVDSGARNIDHLLTNTLLPEISAEILEHMARGESFSGVHISLDSDGGFVYAFNSAGAHEADPAETADQDAAPSESPEGETPPDEDRTEDGRPNSKKWWKLWGKDSGHLF